MSTRKGDVFAPMRLGHFMIEGMNFASARLVHEAAVSKGFNGSNSTIDARLRSGAKTWAELTAPVNDKASRASKVAQTKRARNARAEMTALCADLDARKAASKVAA